VGRLTVCEEKTMFEEKTEKMNNVAVTPAIYADSESPFIKRTYTVDEIQDILGVSQSSTYNFVKQGLFRTVRVVVASEFQKRALTSGWTKTYKVQNCYIRGQHERT
jgi:hypothetical protein